MAKATNPRKPARDKRKGGAAAKRTARKSAARARKVTTKAARPRRSSGADGRPGARQTLHRVRRPAEKRSRRGHGPEAQLAPTSVIAQERVPPPLPVPIASFTF